MRNFVPYRMSLSLVSSEIDRFLSSKDPEIICIKGRWGVGKTYAWRKLLKQAQLERRIMYDKYSYISLFGRNSLDDLRNSITENTISTQDVEAKPSLTSLDNATSLLRQGFQKGGLLASLLPQSNAYAQLGQRMLYLFVRNTIVCLDDLERAGTGLTMKDVLGLASQLKDEKSCKVAILLNDEKLAGAAKDDFHTQLEKVVDVVIDFELLPPEAADIALDTQTIFHDALRANCINLKIDNIRVIKKAERYCARLATLLSAFDKRLLHQAVHTATIACYAKYQPDKAPSLSYIRAFDPWDEAVRKANGDKGQLNPHHITIQEYGINVIDSFDESILDTIEKGFFDEEQIQTEAKRINDNLRTTDMQADYRRAWSMYHSSFAKNEEEFVNTMIQVVERNVSVIDPPNLDSVVSMLRELGYGDRASKLVKFFMTAKQQHGPSYWELRTFGYRGKIRDAEIIQAMADRLCSFDYTISPLEHLKKIGERQGWSEEDEAAILQLSEHDLAEIFLRSAGEDLRQIVFSYKFLLSISNPNSNLSEICRRAKLALTKVSEESKLNAMRVRSLFYDVSIEI